MTKTMKKPIRTNTIAEKVLEKIEKQHTVPYSRFYFSIRNVLIWLFAAFALLIGALAVSSIIFRLANVPRMMPPGGQIETIHGGIAMLPILWIIVLGIFGYVAYREIRLTKQGYRYELSTLLLAMVVISGVSGIALYSVGSGYVLDRTAAQYVPFHRDIELLQQNAWLKPENGFLVGEVLEVTDAGFTLSDPESKAWDVVYADSLTNGEKETVTKGTHVGIRGEQLDAEGGAFLACKVRSLELKGKGPFMRPPLKERGERADRVIRTNGERKMVNERTTECEGVRPPRRN